MAWQRLAIAALACTMACASADDDVEYRVNEAAHLRTAGLDEDVDYCELLPPCGPCSKLCDRDALEAFVPVGTCAAFVCELTNGDEVVVHVCHPEE